MDLILSLPLEISGQLLSAWLDIDDVGRLDAASCSKKCHPAWEVLLASQFVTHPNNKAVELWDLCESYTPATARLFLNWLEKRKVKVSKFILFDEAEFNLPLFCDPVVWKHLRIAESIVNSSTKKCWNMSLAYAASFQNCPNVEQLDLSNCNLAEDSLEFILSCCPRLKNLNVTRPKLTAADCSIAKHCHQLTTLEISFCELSGDALGAIGRGNPHVHTLILNDCVEFNDDGSIALQAVMHFPNLRHLGMRNCFWPFSPGRFAVHCPLLEAIELFNTTHVTSNYIQHIRIFGNDNISDIGITALAQGCKLLQVVELRTLERITHLSVRVIAENSSAALREVLVHNCKSVLTDYSFAYLASHDHGCRATLEKVDIAGCNAAAKEIMLDGTHNLLHCCPRLTLLGLDADTLTEAEQLQFGEEFDTVVFLYRHWSEFENIDVNEDEEEEIGGNDDEGEFEFAHEYGWDADQGEGWDDEDDDNDDDDDDDEGDDWEGGKEY